MAKYVKRSGARRSKRSKLGSSKKGRKLSKSDKSKITKIAKWLVENKTSKQIRKLYKKMGGRKQTKKILMARFIAKMHISGCKGMKKY